MQGVGAGFCPLGELVQGDGYGRRPPGRSPGRAPLRGASPLRSSGEPAAGLLRPAQAVKRESVPCAAAMLPALPLPGRRGLCCGVGAGFCPLGELVQGDGYGRRPPGRSPGRAPRRGASPAAEQRGACGRPPAPCTGCKKGKCPRATPRKSTCPIYNRIAPPPGAFLHHGGRGGIGWCSGRPSRRPIDT